MTELDYIRQEIIEILRSNGIWITHEMDFALDDFMKVVVYENNRIITKELGE